MEGWDTENPTERSIKTQSFSVGATGIEFGDSECTLDFVAGVEEGVPAVVEADLTTDATDNAITNTVNTVIGITGLGGTTLWIFGMAVLTILIWFEGIHIISGNATLGTIVILTFFDILCLCRFFT